MTYLIELFWFYFSHCLGKYEKGNAKNLAIRDALSVLKQGWTPKMKKSLFTRRNIVFLNRSYFLRLITSHLKFIRASLSSLQLTYYDFFYRWVKYNLPNFISPERLMSISSLKYSVLIASTSPILLKLIPFEA